MPARPERIVLTNSSVDVLNAIRNSASVDYREHVPIATPDSDCIRQIGAIIMDMPQLQNEFLNALINRIGRVLISSRMYENPWSMFKLGKLEFGEVVEDVFVELAKPHQYDPEFAEVNVEAREIPDLKSAFYIINYEKFYKRTVEDYDLRKAFLSIDGVTNLIAKIVESMYTSANYDEFLTMKYLLARRILQGQIPVVNIDDFDGTDDMTKLATAAKSVSNKMTFLNTTYNIAGVHNFAPKSEQYLIMNAEVDASMDVNVLASAFNMDKAEFMGHRVLVDNFAIEDLQRLDELFGDQENYVEFTEADITALENVKAVLVDESFFKVIDIYDTTNTRYNEEGLYRNYWYHVGKSFCTSPFANCALFADGSATVSAVTASPASVTLAVGATAQATAEVTATGFGSLAVNWTTSDPTVATVNATGIITAVGAGTATITATSVEDGTVTDTISVTVTSGE